MVQADTTRSVDIYTLSIPLYTRTAEGVHSYVGFLLAVNLPLLCPYLYTNTALLFLPLLQCPVQSPVLHRVALLAFSLFKYYISFGVSSVVIKFGIS